MVMARETESLLNRFSWVLVHEERSMVQYLETVQRYEEAMKVILTAIEQYMKGVIAEKEEALTGATAKASI